MLRQKLRRAGVGGNHEFFNQLARAVLLLLADVHHTVAVEHGARLKGFQVQRAGGAPARTHALGHRVLGAQLLVHAGHSAGGLGQVAFAFDPRCHRVVGQLGVVAHARAVHRGMGDNAFRIHHHFGHDGKPILARVQRGEVGGQALGQH